MFVSHESALLNKSVKLSQRVCEEKITCNEAASSFPSSLWYRSRLENEGKAGFLCATKIFKTMIVIKSLNQHYKDGGYSS